MHGQVRGYLIRDTTSPSWNKPQKQELVTNDFFVEKLACICKNIKVNMGLLFLF